MYLVEEIKFTKELSDITVTDIGVKVTFECELSRDSLKVDWYRGNKPLRKSAKHDMVDEGRLHNTRQST